MTAGLKGTLAMRRLTSGLLLVAMLTGCASSRSWSYTPEPRSATEHLANVSVVVLPFEDRHPKENSNFTFIYLIPLVPFGWMDFETPEGPQMHVNSGLWQFRPADDFARAVAQEIDNARIFRETFVGNRASEGEYVLLGEITSTKYEGKMITYGLSVYCPLLWFFGFPAAYTTNGLTLTLKLAKTPRPPLSGLIPSADRTPPRAGYTRFNRISHMTNYSRQACVRQSHPSPRPGH